MRVPTPLFLVCLSLAVAACNCGNPRLTIHEQPTLADGGRVASVCGNGFVEAPHEECDFGAENNLGGPVGSCNPDCFLSRACPAGSSYDEARIQCVAMPDGGLDAGWDAGSAPPRDAGVGAKVVGVLAEYAGALSPSVLHPNVPIDGATVHLRARGAMVDLSTRTTGPDGRFEFDVSPGAAYDLVHDTPSAFYNEGTPRPVPLAMPGETVRADLQFLRKGVSFVVRTLASSTAIPGVEVTVVAPGNRLIAGPRLTDAEGFVHFPPTSERGVMVFQKAGYRRYELGMPSVDTTSTVVGGCGLEVE
jgi:hypothetical protein